VLQQEGFSDIDFPARSAHEHGQQIIVAHSDGLIRQAVRAHQPARPAADTSRSGSSVATLPEPQPLTSRSNTSGSDAGGDTSELRSRGIAYLRQLVGDTLEIPLHQLDPSEPLQKYGIDSILAVRLTEALRGSFTDITSTVFFEHESIEALLEHLLQTNRARLAQLVGAQSPATPVAASVFVPLAARAVRVQPAARRVEQQQVAHASTSEPANRDIAIIGLTGRYPLAPSTQVLWENLLEGKDCITEVPADRWNWRQHFDAEKGAQGTSYSRWGGFLDEVAQFDPLFFNISPKEAQWLDPQDRLFLETVWNLLEEAGYTRAALREHYHARVGVYVGAMYQQQYHADDPDVAAGATASSSFSGIANRVSYFFGLEGPSIAVDTMCSSAAVAIHTACRDLLSGECALAIAGGVNLSLSPKKYIGLSQAHLLGSDPRSRSFSDGDGFLPAETVGAVLLKPMAAAIADQDTIFAVIKATATNHSGRSNGYFTPNPNAQAKLIVDALRKAGVDARTVSYVEASASGSQLGDPVELAGLTKAFRQFTADEGFCAVGSVKSNIGHAEAASAISQLAKVVLQLRHRRLVPTISTAPLNPRISFERSPFFLQQDHAEWQQPSSSSTQQAQRHPRRALINSYGAGGSNVCMVIEEYLAAAQTLAMSEDGSAQLLVFSARTDQQLEVLVRLLLEHLQGQPSFDLAELAYTLQIGREAMESRLAMVVTGRDDSFRKMSAYLERDGQGSFHVGSLLADRSDLIELTAGKAGEVLIQALLAERELERLGLLWTRGARIPWQLLHAHARRRMLLPTYPFAKQRYWIPESTQSGLSVPAVPSAASPVAIQSLEPRTAPEVGERASPASAEECITRFMMSALSLTREQIHPHKEMQDYGMDSILGARLIRVIAKELNIILSGRELMEHRTLRALTTHLTRRMMPPGQPEISRDVMPPIDAYQVQAVLQGQVGVGDLTLDDLMKFKHGELDLATMEKLLEGRAARAAGP
jgi:3-oxoacyl-(acyl-carrier-protein) synthase/aryl carrier-like protein